MLKKQPVISMGDTSVLILLRQDMHLHMEANPYVCRLCGKAFGHGLISDDVAELISKI